MNEYYSYFYKEIEDNENPYFFEKIFFYGFDLNSELLEKIDSVDWIGLTFFERKINKEEKEIIQKLPIMIANKGFRDASILGGATIASQGAPNQNSLMGHIGINGGLVNGAREVFYLVNLIHDSEGIDDLINKIINMKGYVDENFGEINNLIGINDSEEEPKYINELLIFFSKYKILKNINYLNKEKNKIEEKTKGKIKLNFLLALILVDLKIPLNKVEYYYFYITIPFAVSIIDEQRKNQKFPFYNNVIKKDNQ